MELKKQPQTELEYWETIESLGAATWGFDHDLSDGRIEDPDGSLAREVQEGHALSERIVGEACEKFGLVHPKDYPARQPDEPLPPPPEGKHYYWDWYKSMKRSWLSGMYGKLICSACPLSEGEEEFIRANGRIPCGPWNGMLGDLTLPFLCAMVSWKYWTRARLIKEVRRKGGVEMVENFMIKEEQLKRVAKATTP